MGQSKETIEKQLKEMLHEMLRSHGQEDSIISLEYDDVSQECTVKMTVHIVEEDNYIGFAGY